MIDSHGGGAADENLLNVRLGGAGHASDGVDINRGVAPAEEGEAFFANNAFQNSLCGKALMAFHRHKDHTDAVLARGRQGEADLCGFTNKERVWNLDQQACAIAGIGI